MVKKLLLQSWLKKIQRGGVRVVFWDGETVDYGNTAPKVSIIFHKEPDLNGELEDPMVFFGESYMDGVFDFSGDFDEIIRLAALNKENFAKKGVGGTMAAVLHTIDKEKQKENIHHHYDLGNDFFSLWLDETMSYSCAYFKHPEDTLYQAQINKIHHILRKLDLHPGERLLDIGSGWGWLIIMAAKYYGVHATGVTLSEEQYKATQERIARLGMSGQVEVQLANYLDLDEKKAQYDKIASVGMFEHVGKENLPRFMEKVNQLLVPQGLMLLHTISGVDEKNSNSWMAKYIFPGGYVPSLRETIWLLPEYDFHVLQIESLRMHYAKTLDHWYGNFKDCIDTVEKKFGPRFIRMWSLYLKGCAAAFRVSGLDVHQILFSKGLNNQLPLTYERIYRA